MNKAKKKNPILKAYKYLEYLESQSSRAYKDVAEKFNVSKVQVSQMIALVKRLPREMIDYFVNSSEPVDPCSLTEKGLRPLTLMESGGAKIKMFREMKEKVK